MNLYYKQADKKLRVVQSDVTGPNDIEENISSVIDLAKKR